MVGKLVTAETTPAASASGPAGPAPTLSHAFTTEVMLAPPVEYGVMDGRRRRFIAITGGTVGGPWLQGTVLGIGGDWQDIGDDGVATLDTRYALKAADGTVIDIRNPGVRVGSAEVTGRLARGEPVDPEGYISARPRVSRWRPARTTGCAARFWSVAASAGRIAC